MRKNIFMLILAVVMLFSLSLSAFAAEEETDMTYYGSLAVEVPAPIDGTRSLSGYASKFVSTSEVSSFTVPVTGSSLWSSGLTFKTSCDESEYPLAVITIKRPNGGYILQEVTFTANQERYFTFYFPESGNYTVEYAVYVPSGATVQMQCWIY